MVDERQDDDGLASLHVAARSGDTAMVSLLLQKGELRKTVLHQVSAVLFFKRNDLVSILNVHKLLFPGPRDLFCLSYLPSR